MTLSFKSVLSRRSQRKGHARGPWCRLSLPMNQLCARVCETETDWQVQEEEVHSAAVLAGFIPVSPGIFPGRVSALPLERPLHSVLTLVF